MSISLGDLSLPSPVMTAAGCGGPELSRFCDLATLGACVTQTVTLDPVEAVSPWRHAETPSGVLTTEGLANPGLQAFLATTLPELVRQRARVVVSVAGETLGEYAELARRAGGAPGVAALEVRLPDDPQSGARLLGVVRRDTPPGVAVLAKLPLGDRVAALATAAGETGVDALVVGGPRRGIVVDPATLTALPGRLSGPAVAPLALEAVWTVHEALPDTPLVGVGGIRTGADALAMLAAGASAVQVGTAVVHDPSAAHRVQSELAALLEQRGLKHADAVGIAHRGGLP